MVSASDQCRLQPESRETRATGKRLGGRPDLDRTAALRQRRDVGAPALLERDPPAIGRRHQLEGVLGARVDDLEGVAGGDAGEHRAIAAPLLEVEARAGGVEARVRAFLAHERGRAAGGRHDEDAGLLAVVRPAHVVAARRRDRRCAGRRARTTARRSGRASSTTSRPPLPSAPMVRIRPRSTSRHDA